MKDIEKQIEEMAKDCYYVAHLLRFNDPYMLSLKGWSKLTKEMIKLGWIKPVENSVVLSADEFANLKKYAYKKGSKETAEKIINVIDKMQKPIEPSNYYQHDYYERLGFEKGLIAVKTKIAKEFDVEIKE